MTVNFLQETLETLKMHGYAQEDVSFIGLDEDYFFWDDFKRQADFCYDNGYGYIEIPIDLKIVMADGSWFERAEYDGAEEWRHIKLKKTDYIKYTPNFLKQAMGMD